MAVLAAFNVGWNGQRVTLTDDEVKAALPPGRIRQLAQDQFTQHMEIAGIHGQLHWMKVLENGLLLAKLNGANPKVLSYFAFLHDCQRYSDGRDEFHGQRAAGYVSKIRKEIDLADDAFDLLVRAIRLHNRPLNTDVDLTVMTCWDADRLNLLRVGTQPNPRYLCTQAGRDPEVIAWANERARNMWAGRA
jgi:uncharacterized protein